MNLITSTDVQPAGRHQGGFSLIELMVAMVIGLLVMAALSILFVGQMRTRDDLDKSNRMIDNGRYAMDVLSEALRVAGYYDNYAPLAGTPASTPAPCTLSNITTPTTNLDVLRHHVQGYDAATSTSAVSDPPCELDGELRAGSDVLVLRRASTTSVVAGAAVGATTYLQVSNCTTDVTKYQIVAGSAPLTAFRKKDCSSSADLRQFVEQVYFISPDNESGDGIPTLKRVELDSASQFVITPLVEGIEYLQIDYGVDADGDGAAESYIATPTLAQWPNVVSLEINLIARSLDPVNSHVDSKTYELGSAGTFGPFGDGYKRHAFTQVVRLVNPSSRRELP